MSFRSAPKMVIRPNSIRRLKSTHSRRSACAEIKIYPQAGRRTYESWLRWHLIGHRSQRTRNVNSLGRFSDGLAWPIRKADQLLFPKIHSLTDSTELVLGVPAGRDVHRLGLFDLLGQEDLGVEHSAAATMRKASSTSENSAHVRGSRLPRSSSRRVWPNSPELAPDESW